MHSLAIDVGNARIKVGYFQHHQLVLTKGLPDYEALLAFADYYTLDAVILATVVPLPDAVSERLRGIAPLWRLSKALKLPLHLAYQTPETLGQDRLAGAIGASTLFPGQPCLAIDIGSCITYDFVSADGIFTGGSISPGLQMRLRAMAYYTAALPLVAYAWDQVPPLTGRSTQAAMLSGAVRGVLNEMEGFIAEYLQAEPDLQVVLSGGNAAFFASNLKRSIFAEPHLVLKGLHQILLFNA